MSLMVSMREQVMGYLDRNGWKYDASDPRSIKCAVQLAGRLEIVDMRLYFSDFGYILYDIIRGTAASSHRAEVMRFITMANYRLRNGCFEIDMSTGEVRFRLYTHFSGLVVLPDDIIAESVLVPLSTIEQYGDGLAGVMTGAMDAYDAMERVEEEELNDLQELDDGAYI